MKLLFLNILFISFAFNTFSQEMYEKNLQQTEDQFYTEFVIKMAEGFSNGYEFYAKNYFKMDEIKKIIKDKKEVSDFSSLIDKYKITKLPRPKIVKEGIEFDINGKRMLITAEGYLRGYFELDGKKIAINDEKFNIEKSVELIKKSLISRDFSYSKFFNFLISNAHAKEEVTEERVIMALVAEVQLKWLFPEEDDSEFVEILDNEMALDEKLTQEDATKYMNYNVARWRDRVMKNINTIYKKSRYILENCKKTQEVLENGVTAENLENYIKNSLGGKYNEAPAQMLLNDARKTDRFVNYWLYNLGWENYKDKEHMEKQKSFINALMRKFLFQKFDKNEKGLTCSSGLEKSLYIEISSHISPVVAQDIVHKRYKKKNLDHENPCQVIRELTKCLADIDQKDKRRVLEELSRKAGKQLYRYKDVPDDKKQHPGWGQVRD